MLIKKLIVENFKGIRSPVEFDFAAITLLFGPNSAGKSTILHALSYLNDVVNQQEYDSDTTVLGEGAINLGGFRQFINDHDISKSVKLAVELDLTKEDLSETKAAESYLNFYNSLADKEERELLVDLGEISGQVNEASISLEIAWSDYSNTPYVKMLVLMLNDQHLMTIKGNQSQKGGVITELNLDHRVLLDVESTLPVSILSPLVSSFIEDQFLEDNGNALIGLEETKDALPNWKGGLKFADIWSVPVHQRQKQEMLFVGVIQALLCGTLELIGNDLAKTKYIGPLRTVPQRNFICSKNSRQSWANGLAAWDCLSQRGDPFVNEVNRWLANEDKLNSGYEVVIQRSKNLSLTSQLIGLLEADELTANKQLIQGELDKLIVNEKVVLKDIRRNVEVQPLDVGAGISQVIPVIVGALERKISMLMVEQPELHIHPKLQVELAELMLEASVEYGKSFLLETHSEHLVLRMLRKIKNKEVDPSQVVIYYIDTVGSETKVRKIRINNDGTFLDRWPKGGFFPERAKELLDALR